MELQHLPVDPQQVAPGQVSLETSTPCFLCTEWTCAGHLSTCITEPHVFVVCGFGPKNIDACGASTLSVGTADSAGCCIDS